MTEEEKCIDTIDQGLNSVLWVANNDHLITDPTFREFFDAAIKDVHLAKAAIRELRAHL